MEDQPVDSGDLTAAAAAVPQGKAARKRHRLPRAQLRRPDQAATAEDGAGSEAAEDATPDAEAIEPVADDVEAEAETPDAVEPETPVETTPKRRRFSWRRSAPAETAVPVGTDTPDTAEASVSDAAAAPESADEVSNAAVGDEPAQPDDAGQPDDAVQPDDVAQPEPVLVRHRTAGRPFKVAAVVAGALFVAAAAFAGATVQPLLADRAAAHTKFEIAERAAAAITTLWTYTPEDMDTLPGRASKFLTGDFAAEYRTYIDAISESNKQAQVSNDTQVLGVAVESLTPTEASALVYTNSVATSPVTKGIPSLRYLSYRLTMEERDRQWLVTRMTAVTSLDLTPRL